MTVYNSGFDTDNDSEYFDRDSDDDTDEDVLTQDISVGISQIASVVDERGFWVTMPDLQRIKDLRHGLRSTERYTVGRGNNFGMFPGNYEEMSKHWTESLKVQERRLKLKECGSEAVGDIEDDDEEDDNEDNEGENSEGARLEFASRQVCTSWEEAWDSVVEELSLNEKQRRLLMLIAKKFSKETTEVTGKQILSYLGREGGMGKSHIIHGVKLLVEKMGRRDLLQLAGASGSVADNINGSTTHSCLRLEIRKSNVTRKGKMPDKVPSDGRLKTLKRLWKKKQILIIDEISMVNQRTLYEIDRKCRILKDDESPFGGIAVVMLCGDFYQMPPVTGRPLYWNSNVYEDSDNEIGARETVETDDMKGMKLWHQFDKVFLLTEQMRQAEDVEYQEMLSRARAGGLTERDYDKLTSRITNILEFGPGSPKIITHSNTIRHQLNLMGVLGFAVKVNEPVYLFITENKQHSEVSRSELLGIWDKSSDLPGSGIFPYMKEMPIIINSNCCTALGIVNGKEG